MSVEFNPAEHFRLCEEVPSEQMCRWCGEEKSLHVTYPARSNYWQCRREVAPFVGCTFEAETDLAQQMEDEWYEEYLANQEPC